MTAGDFGRASGLGSPLRAARLRAGWTQASAMRRFREAAMTLGSVPPDGPSLKRMFAYWEAGEREVSVAAYQDAFCAIYSAPPEALGFAGQAPLATEGKDLRAELDLVSVDAALVALLESQTEDLRLLDRRLGSAARIVIVEAHAEQIEGILHRCVGTYRPQLAAALAEAAALAGWLALDRCDIRGAWHWHELARSAALESGSSVHLGHVLAQTAIVLLDAGQTIAARDAAQEASRIVSESVPPIVAAWVAASEAEVLSGAGEAVAANRRFDHAQARFAAAGSEEVPFVMLSKGHLERWRGHCLTRQGNPAALAVVAGALVVERDSLRASAGLHTDLASALLIAGEREESAKQALRALDLAHRCGSARQTRRLRAVLAAAQGEDVKQTDECP